MYFTTSFILVQYWKCTYFSVLSVSLWFTYCESLAQMLSFIATNEPPAHKKLSLVKEIDANITAYVFKEIKYPGQDDKLGF